MSYIAAVDGRIQWIGMHPDAVSAIAMSTVYARVYAVLSCVPMGMTGIPDVVERAQVIMGTVLDAEPTLAKCNDIGPVESGWAFSVAMWPGSAAYLVVACGPERQFGWFSIPSA